MTIKKSINKKQAYQVVIELYKRLVFEPKARLQVTGSLLRDDKIIHDIDFLVITDKPIIHIDLLNNHQENINDIKIISFGEYRIIMNVNAYNKIFKIDFFITSKKDLLFAEFQYDYRKSYNIRIRAYAKKKGYLLNQYGLFNKKTGKRIKNNFIHLMQITQFLGLHYRDPLLAV